MTVVMTIQRMRKETFEKVTKRQWELSVEKSIKGAALETLEKLTYEQIKLKPLYVKADVEKHGKKSLYPGVGDYRRGNNLAGYKTSPWIISQRITAENPRELKNKLTGALKNGQTALSFQMQAELLSDAAAVSAVLGDVYTAYPFALHLKEDESKFLHTLADVVKKDRTNKEHVTGFIAADPLAQLVAQGGLQQSIAVTYNRWAETLQFADEEFPHLKTIGIDTTIYHAGGAHAVQEIALALACGVFHIEELSKRGLSLETIVSKMIFRFSVGANFFMEIAKLRAARIVWSKITEAYHVAEPLRNMDIAAETSLFTKTTYDPHVNILRGANEAFAAVLGGVQYMHIGRFDETYEQATELSERIARNTQLILREEAMLQQIVDPAGGSWYIESLTNELAEKAWNEFLAIDEQGGIVAALESGTIQEAIGRVKAERTADVLTKKQTIVGTNKYVNVLETPHQKRVEKDESSDGPLKERVERLRDERLAAPVEQIREKEGNQRGEKAGI